MEVPEEIDESLLEPEAFGGVDIPSPQKRAILDIPSPQKRALSRLEQMVHDDNPPCTETSESGCVSPSPQSPHSSRSWVPPAGDVTFIAPAGESKALHCGMEEALMPVLQDEFSPAMPHSAARHGRRSASRSPSPEKQSSCQQVLEEISLPPTEVSPTSVNRIQQISETMRPQRLRGWWRINICALIDENRQKWPQNTYTSTKQHIDADSAPEWSMRPLPVAIKHRQWVERFAENDDIFDAFSPEAESPVMSGGGADLFSKTLSPNALKMALGNVQEEQAANALSSLT